MWFCSGFYFSAYILFLVHAGKIDKRCITPTGEASSCINLNYCQPFLDVLDSNPTEDQINFIRTSSCGFTSIGDHVVCCGKVSPLPIPNNYNEEDDQGEVCISPSGEKGSCVNIDQCQHYQNILNIKKEHGEEYLRTAACGFTPTAILKICCKQVA